MRKEQKMKEIKKKSEKKWKKNVKNREKKMVENEIGEFIRFSALPPLALTTLLLGVEVRSTRANVA